MEEKLETGSHKDSFLPTTRPGLSPGEHKKKHTHKTQTLSHLLCVVPSALTLNIVNETFQGQVQLTIILHELSYTTLNVLPPFTAWGNEYVTPIVRIQKSLKFKDIRCLLDINVGWGIFIIFISISSITSMLKIFFPLDWIARWKPPKRNYATTMYCWDFKKGKKWDCFVSLVLNKDAKQLALKKNIHIERNPQESAIPVILWWLKCFRNSF